MFLWQGELAGQLASASKILFNKTKKNILSANNMQDAIDEVSDNLTELKTNVVLATPKSSSSCSVVLSESAYNFREIVLICKHQNNHCESATIPIDAYKVALTTTYKDYYFPLYGSNFAKITITDDTHFSYTQSDFGLYEVVGKR